MHHRDVHLHPIFTRMIASRTVVDAEFEKNLWKCIVALHTVAIKDASKDEFPIVTIGNCSLHFDVALYPRSRIEVKYVESDDVAVADIPIPPSAKTVSFHVDFSLRCQRLAADPDTFTYMSTAFWEDVFTCHMRDFARINGRATLHHIRSHRSPLKLIDIDIDRD